ncbi:hypothetical protein EDB89DRAFT_1913290 [Lactarius sanguifluus]|nr:hypothetical protein EDB89DRAFT_1913290 [Lactarius sanguifluus]
MRGQAMLLAMGVVRSCCVGVATGLVGVVLGLVGVASGLVGVAPGLVGVVPGLAKLVVVLRVATAWWGVIWSSHGGVVVVENLHGSNKRWQVETQLDVSRVLVIVVVAVGKVRVGLFIRMEQIGGREGDEP